jgi:hypothetical protein
MNPEFQLAFLNKIQRLFAEGDFTASYKYALLIAIADIAVESGRDDDQPLAVPHRRLGEKFIELYWQQSSPYKTLKSNDSGVLYQNHGTQAAIIKAIQVFRDENRFNSPNAAKHSKEYKKSLFILKIEKIWNQ